MGKTLLIARLALKDIRHRPAQSIILLLAIATGAATTIGRPHRGHAPASSGRVQASAAAKAAPSPTKVDKRGSRPHIDKPDSARDQINVPDTTRAYSHTPEARCRSSSMPDAISPMPTIT